MGMAYCILKKSCSHIYIFYHCHRVTNQSITGSFWMITGSEPGLSSVWNVPVLLNVDEYFSQK